MTPEQQRIALAKWAGWESNQPSWDYGRGFPPDYLNDLNAVHDLEQKLSFQQQTEYVANLMRLYKDYPMTSAFMATAAQRCEALLKTLNLWKGNTP